MTLSAIEFLEWTFGENFRVNRMAAVSAIARSFDIHMSDLEASREIDRLVNNDELQTDTEETIIFKAA